MDSSSIGNVVYCCVSIGNKILYMYNAGDRNIESLANLCLDNSPLYHSEYFHTVGDRTFGFLMEGRGEQGKTCFAIVDQTKGSPGVRKFLKHLRDGFKKSPRNGLQDELVPVIRRLMQSLESMSGPSGSSTSLKGSAELCMSTVAPLLGNGAKLNRKKSRDRTIEVEDICSGHNDRGVRIDIADEHTDAGVVPISLQKSTSARLQMQQMARRLWCRYVKIVVLVDILLCLVLCCIWLAICKGLQCVQG